MEQSGDSEKAIECKSAAEALIPVEDATDEKEVKRSGALNGARRIVEQLSDETSVLNKTVKGVKTGASIVRDIMGTYSSLQSSTTSPHTGTLQTSLTRGNTTVASEVTIDADWYNDASGTVGFDALLSTNKTDNDPVNISNAINSSYWSYSFSHDFGGTFTLDWDANIEIISNGNFWEHPDTDAGIRYQINGGEWSLLDRTSRNITYTVEEGGVFDFAMGWNGFGPNSGSYFAIPYSVQAAWTLDAEWAFVENTPPTPPASVPEPGTALLITAGFFGLMLLNGRRK